jgi:branched-chain amino acid aminotransferase
VFESTRTFKHKPFKLEEHLERLYLSLKLARINPGLSFEQMLRVTHDVLAANIGNYAEHEDCWISHNISRGIFNPSGDPTDVGAATIIIYTQLMDLKPWVRFYTDGCHGVTPITRAVPNQSLDLRIKNRSRLAYTLAEIEAKFVDPDAQSVILDLDGNVTENKGGNIFCVRDGVLKTPTTINCLAGITRATTLSLAKQLSIPTEEKSLQPYDLATADEMFFTSTPYCIMPATKFNNLVVGNGKVGPITKRLLQAWSELVGLDVVAQAQAQIN